MYSTLILNTVTFIPPTIYREILKFGLLLYQFQVIDNLILNVTYITIQI